LKYTKVGHGNCWSLSQTFRHVCNEPPLKFADYIWNYILNKCSLLHPADEELVAITTFSSDSVEVT
jgi:hypothetical protein